MIVYKVSYLVYQESTEEGWVSSYCYVTANDKQEAKQTVMNYVRRKLGSDVVFKDKYIEVKAVASEAGIVFGDTFC